MKTKVSYCGSNLVRAHEESGGALGHLIKQTDMNKETKPFQREMYAVTNPIGEIDWCSLENTEEKSINRFCQIMGSKWSELNNSGWTCVPVSVSISPPKRSIEDLTRMSPVEFFVRQVMDWYQSREAIINPSITADVINNSSRDFKKTPLVKGIVVMKEDYPLCTYDISLEDHIDLFMRMNELRLASPGRITQSTGVDGVPRLSYEHKGTYVTKFID